MSTCATSSNFACVGNNGENPTCHTKSKQEGCTKSTIELNNDDYYSSESEDEEYAKVVKEFKNIIKKAKRDSSDEECSTSKSNNEVRSETKYYSNKNLSLDEKDLDNKYCRLYKVMAKNKSLKHINNQLENEVLKLKIKLQHLEKGKEVFI